MTGWPCSVSPAVATRLCFVLATCCGVPGVVAQLPVPEWRWRLVRPLVAENGPPLVRIGSSVASTGWGVALSQPTEGTIVFYDEQGRFLQSLGRKGEGPGEFKNAWLMRWAGDSLFVSDPSLRRVTFIGKNRQLSSTVPYPLAVYSGSGAGRIEASLHGLFPQGLLPDGTWVVDVVPTHLNRLPLGAAARVDRTARATLKIDADGRFISHFASPSRDNPDCSIAYSIGRGTGFLPVPYCEQSLYIHSSDANRIAVVSATGQDNRSARLSIAIVGATGGTSATSQVRVERIALEAWRADSAKKLLRKQFERDPMALDRLSKVRLPRYLPLVRRGLFSTEGNLWLEFWSSDATHRRWLVFNSSGQPTGSITLPENILIQAVSRSSVFATVRSDLDEESLIVLSLDVK